MSDRAAKRVLARYLQAGVPDWALQSAQQQDEGAFILFYTSRHAAAVPDVAAAMHKAIKLCETAGLPIKDKIHVTLTGKGGAHRLAVYSGGSVPPTMGISPKAFKDPDLVKTLVHELGHYVHDKIVKGGFTNQEVIDRYEWAVGEGQAAVPTLRKGKPFDFVFRGSGLFGFSESNRGYPVTGQIVGKKGQRLTVMILKYPKEVLRDPKFRADFVKTVTTWEGSTATGSEEVIMDRPIVELTLREVQYDMPTGKGESRLEWVPTTYAKKNSHEWFAELAMTFVLGHLSKDPSAWLVSVVKTGKAQ